MSGKAGWRSRAARVLRPAFERILLIGSVVGGLAVVGSCVSGTTGDDTALSLAVGVVFAMVLVGAVFLFTTMSRDLRLLRERFADNGEPSASNSSRDDSGPRSPRASV